MKYPAFKNKLTHKPNLFEAIVKHGTLSVSTHWNLFSCVLVGCDWTNMSDVEGLLEEEKDLGETGGPGFGHTVPCECSALCFSL